MTTQDKIVSKSGFLTVTLNQDPSYLFFKWENFGISLKDCQDAFAQAEKVLVDRGLHCIVSDVVDVKQELRPEVAQWWGEVCMPSLAQCGVKLIVNLLPAAVGGQPSDESGPTVMGGIVMQKAFSVKEAEALVRSF